MINEAGVGARAEAHHQHRDVTGGRLRPEVHARSRWCSGLRQLAIGGLAAAPTWGLGTLIGAAAP